MIQNHDIKSEAVAYSVTVTAAVNVLMTASGLTKLAAKTCVYYAVGTYGLGELNLYPLLVFYGATGTGKSAAMKALGMLVCKPVWLGTNLTQANLRDKLDKAREASAFLEEGDTTYEEYIANRYSRGTSESSVKRSVKAGWADTSVKYFGATILHKRKPFSDPATDSRSIVIRTRPQPGRTYYLPEVDETLKEGLKEIWRDASGVYKSIELSGRAADVWKPLIAVATVCGDEEWLEYAKRELANAADKLRLGQEFEPEAMLINILIGISHKKKDGDLLSLSEIKDELKRENNWQPTSWELASMLRDLGMELKKSHGQQKVVINRIKLANIAEGLGIEGASEELLEVSTRNLV